MREFAAQGVDVEVIWRGPLREDEREAQIQVVEGFISQGISGIVLAPLDDRALIRPVEEAKRAGIPTVIIDSGLQTDQIVSFVATDNFKGGTLAADRMGELLKGKGKILMLRYQEGSASTEQRRRDSCADQTKFPGIEVVSSNQFAAHARHGQGGAENLLTDVHGRPGIFTPNESSPRHAARAPGHETAGKVSFVGFDSSQTSSMRCEKTDGRNGSAEPLQHGLPRREDESNTVRQPVENVSIPVFPGYA